MNSQNKVLNLLSATSQLLITGALHMTGFFIALEFFYLALTSQITNQQYVILLSIILSVISLYQKKNHPEKFSSSNMNKLSTFYFSVALSVVVITQLNQKFALSYATVTKNFEEYYNLNIIKEFIHPGFLIVLVFSLLLALTISLLSKKIKNEHIASFSFMFIVLLTTLLIRFSETVFYYIFYEDILKPTLLFITGSLSIGWFYELFFESTEKN